MLNKNTLVMNLFFYYCQQIFRFLGVLCLIVNIFLNLILSKCVQFYYICKI